MALLGIVRLIEKTIIAMNKEKTDENEDIFLTIMKYILALSFCSLLLFTGLPSPIDVYILENSKAFIIYLPLSFLVVLGLFEVIEVYFLKIKKQFYSADLV